MTMSRVSSPSDLHSLTSASPQCLRALNEGRRTVIRSVVLRAISPENMPLALAACGAPTIQESLRKKGPFDWPGEDAIVEGFMKMRSLPPRTADIDWQRLFRLCGLTEIFIAEFSSAAIGYLRSVLATSAPAHEDSLSDTERERLQRAFFRFEYLRKCFRTGHTTNGWHWTGVGQLFDQVFLEKLEGWEREELSSIYAFMRKRLEATFDEVEDFAIDAFRRGSAEEESEARRQGLTIDKSVPYHNLINVLDYPCLWLFEEGSKYRQQDQVDAILTLGLPFLRKLWTLEPATRAKIVKSYGGVTRFDNFLELFRRRFMLGYYNGPYSEPDDTPTDRELEEGNKTSEATVPDSASHEAVDATNRPNAGWLWSAGFEESGLDDDHELCGWGFARLGLIFWDKPRLESAGLYGTTLKALEELTLDEGPGRHESASVEERLKDEWVTQETMERVAPTLFEHFSCEEKEFLREVEY